MLAGRRIGAAARAPLAGAQRRTGSATRARSSWCSRPTRRSTIGNCGAWRRAPPPASAAPARITATAAATSRSRSRPRTPCRTSRSTRCADARVLPKPLLESLFEAAAEATEQAIVDALFAATTVTGFAGHTRYALTEVAPDWADECASVDVRRASSPIAAPASKPRPRPICKRSRTPPRRRSTSMRRRAAASSSPRPALRPAALAARAGARAADIHPLAVLRHRAARAVRPGDARRAVPIASRRSSALVESLRTDLALRARRTEAGPLRSASCASKPPDTNDGKEMSGLCRSIERPLGDALRERGILVRGCDRRRGEVAGPRCTCCFRRRARLRRHQLAPWGSRWPMGIPRMRMPHAARRRARR